MTPTLKFKGRSLFFCNEGVIMIIIISLLIIGVLANYSGLIAEKLKLPSLIGMMLLGMTLSVPSVKQIPIQSCKGHFLRS